MKIWVDADACPKVVKDIIFRAAERTKCQTILVANQLMAVPPSPFISAITVPSGFDEADNYIVRQLEPNDLVITADIPLAAEVVAKNALALNPRGELYTEANIRERLNMRDFMEQMRATGQVSGGPPPFNQKDRQSFANQLDKILAQNTSR